MHTILGKVGPPSTRTIACSVERDASELPLPEVANAAARVLARHVALSAEDLARETARQFGFGRLGNQVRSVMDAGIARLVQQGRAVMQQDRVRLP